MKLEEVMVQLTEQGNSAAELLDEIQEHFNEARRELDRVNYEKTFVKEFLAVQNSTDFIFMPSEWVKAHLRGLSFMLKMLIHSHPSIERTCDRRTVEFKFPKVQFGQLTKENKTNAYEHCPKNETYIGFANSQNYYSRSLIAGLLKLSEDYPNDKNIFLGVCLFLLKVSKAAEPTPFFTTTYNYIAEQVGCSQASAKKVLAFLEDNAIIRKLSTGSVFTSGSNYAFNKDVIEHNFDFQDLDISDWL